MEFWNPRYLTDALEILDAQTDKVMIASGMTHLLRFYSDFPKGIKEPLDGVLHIGDLPSLSECREETGKYSLGATARFLELENDMFLAQHAPAVWDAARITSVPQIRNRRTVGGELVWGSNHSPLMASLMAYDAEVRVRRVPKAGVQAHEETISLFDFYDDSILRNNGDGLVLQCRNARLNPRDLVIKVSIPDERFRRPGSFSFVRVLRPKISNENPGVVVAVWGQAQNGVLTRAQYVASGLWMNTLRDEIPLEGIKLRPQEFFEKLLNYCDRYPFDNYRKSGPTAKQLGLIVFGLLKEGFSSYMGV